MEKIKAQSNYTSGFLEKYQNFYTFYSAVLLIIPALLAALMIKKITRAIIKN